jgi:hypothetical protein
MASWLVDQEPAPHREVHKIVRCADESGIAL